MTNTPFDQLGPVDYVVVEFPAGRVSGRTAIRHARADVILAQGG